MICSYFSCFYVLLGFDKNSFTAIVHSIAHRSSVSLFVNTSIQFSGLITVNLVHVLYCTVVHLYCS